MTLASDKPEKNHSNRVQQAEAVAGHFEGIRKIQICEPLAGGNIHQSFRVISEGNAYVLQRINSRVFPQPEILMTNADVIHRVLSEHGFPLAWPRYLPTLQGDLWWREAGSLWRLYPLIPSVKTTRNETAGHSAGRAFGCFLRAMAKTEPAKLQPAIVDFHNLDARLKALDLAVAKDSCGRRKRVEDLLKKTDRHRHLARQIRSSENSRIVHNDAKWNNVLFGRNRVANAVIDLDTTMAGQALYDFGDLLRSFCSPAEEDRPPQRIRESLLEAVTRGYVQGAEGSLNKAEREGLVDGPTYMSFMLGVRFLTDFLEGDVYFECAQPDHNRKRAESQLMLADNFAGLRPLLAELLVRSG